MTPGTRAVVPVKQVPVEDGTLLTREAEARRAGSRHNSTELTRARRRRRRRGTATPRQLPMVLHIAATVGTDGPPRRTGQLLTVHTRGRQGGEGAHSPHVGTLCPFFKNSLRIFFHTPGHISTWGQISLVQRIEGSRLDERSLQLSTGHQGHQEPIILGRLVVSARGHGWKKVTGRTRRKGGASN